ncbi:hypothetical protein [Tychonema sp. BBK16]|uniref:hypothetical protein n=1 Tax=Tychonema sp. BBK16 TaxID=2699888 RepID=UPI001F246929|nr:hypothetical protein [Tychonema sp. BBK16]MCF6373847.1 hypothetical protein [Tychonema sp. BBK16]
MILILQDFWDKAEQHYPKQIQKDIDNFRPCLDILRSLTDTIRGTVEIRKAERSRFSDNSRYCRSRTVNCG